MKNVSQDATKIANVLNFMNVEEVFVLWLKNVVQTMTVLHLNLVPQPFLILDKENVRMFVLDLLSAVEMLFVKPVLTVLSVLVRMAILVTQKMTKLDVKRNFVPLTRIVLMRVFVWTTDVFHQPEQVAPQTAIAHRPKIASTATAYTLVIILQLVALMLNVMSTNMTKLVLAPKVSLVTLKLNAFAFPTLVFPIKDVLVA
jgi:hypothetical protein